MSIPGRSPPNAGRGVAVSTSSVTNPGSLFPESHETEVRQSKPSLTMYWVQGYVPVALKHRNDLEIWLKSVEKWIGNEKIETASVDTPSKSSMLANEEGAGVFPMQGPEKRLCLKWKPMLRCLWEEPAKRGRGWEAMGVGGSGGGWGCDRHRWDPGESQEDSF